MLFQYLMSFVFNIKGLLVSIFLLLLVACVSSQSLESTKTHNLAWRNHSMNEVYSHPYYSKLIKKTTILDNGQIMETFTEDTSDFTKPTSCLKIRSDNPMKDKFCSGRGFLEKKCIHQFIYKNDRVLSYDVIGQDCYTSRCKDLPDYNDCYDDLIKENE